MLNKFFEISNDLFCIADKQGICKKVNPAFLRTLGSEERELLSFPLLNFVHPDDIEPTRIQMNRAVQGEEVLNFENRYRHKDGHYIYLQWKSVFSEEDGFSYGIARDVSEQRLKENMLSHLYTILEKNTIFTLTDRKGVIRKGSRLFTEISGYEENEYIGKTHKLINSGEHTDNFFKELWAVITSGETWVGTIKNKKKNGEFYYVHSIITPTFSADGAIEGYISIRFDVTQVHMLKESNEKTLKVLNETNRIAKVGGWELEIESGELTWTDETFRILEVDKKEGQKPHLEEGVSLFTPESKEIIEDALQKAIEQGEGYSLELKALTAKGNIRWVYTNGRANYLNGRIVSLSGTIQDIDKRKKAELELEREKLLNIHKSKLAALGEMSAGIAHEVNNPLSIVTGSIAVLKEKGEGPGNLSKKLDMMEKASYRIVKIISSLKKFSRSSDRISFKSISLDTVLQECVALLAPRFDRHLIFIECETLLNGEGEIFCDEVEIEQVIINLLNNAIDAVRDQNEKWISIKLKEESDQLILRITDSGKGIPENIKDKIFNPFFTTKKVGEGTGLGLSILKGILDSHKAEVALDEKSANTCFQITFPKGSVVTKEVK